MNDPPHDGRSRPQRAGRTAESWAGGDDALFVGVGAICDTAARLTGTDGAAVAVLTSKMVVRELVYATDALAQQIDEVQFTLGEGPCLDAYHHDVELLCPHLSHPDFEMRWPGFTGEVTGLGVSAVFAFPVPGAHRPLGVLELYRSTSGELRDGEHRAAQVCATAVGNALESNWRDALLRSTSEDAAIEEAALYATEFSHTDPFTRSQVHVAAGMVAVQLSVSSDEALDRLRAYSYAQSRSVLAVAADVVARRLSFRDSEMNGGR